jgi:hypothetical protein
MEYRMPIEGFIPSERWNARVPKTTSEPSKDLVAVLSQKVLG